MFCAKYIEKKMVAKSYKPLLITKFLNVS